MPAPATLFRAWQESTLSGMPAALPIPFSDPMPRLSGRRPDTTAVPGPAPRVPELQAAVPRQGRGPVSGVYSPLSGDAQGNRAPRVVRVLLAQFRDRANPGGPGEAGAIPPRGDLAG